jgi:predicted HAD superfamily Cof-like phosphohydrolase
VADDPMFEVPKSRLDELTAAAKNSIPLHERPFEMVLEFHRATNADINVGIDTAGTALRVRLIKEELQELEDALAAGDFVEVADALADLDYVVNGAAVAFGIYLPHITKEVHRSNMTKLDENGDPILREDGKVLKGPLYTPPHIVKALNTMPAVTKWSV